MSYTHYLGGYTVKLATQNISTNTTSVTTVRGNVYIADRQVGYYTWTDRAENQKDDCPYAFSLTGTGDWKRFSTEKAMSEYVQLNLLNEKEFWRFYSDSLGRVYEKMGKHDIRNIERLEEAYPVWTENYINWCDSQLGGPEDWLPPAPDGKWIG